MTETLQNLMRARDLAGPWLRPAFDHAIALAREAEWLADEASNKVQAGIAPAYPPLVALLAEAGREG